MAVVDRAQETFDDLLGRPVAEHKRWGRFRSLLGQDEQAFVHPVQERYVRVVCKLPLLIHFRYLNDENVHKNGCKKVGYCYQDVKNDRGRIQRPVVHHCGTDKKIHANAGRQYDCVQQPTV